MALGGFTKNLLRPLLRPARPASAPSPAAGVQSQARQFKRLIDAVLDRTLAGSDDEGNRYYWRVEKEKDGSETIRRWIKYAGDADGATVPPVWTSWLRGTRHHPPTPEELQKYAFEQQQLRLKVEALKLEERKRALLVKAEAARKQEQEQAVSEIER